MRIYYVGGCVRDWVLKREPKDLDYVVVGATVDEMLALGYTQVGKDFPVFLHPETGAEYALARTERKTGVGYTGFTCECNGVTLEQDLERRDLTMNSMALPVDWDRTRPVEQQVIDPYGGMEDIKHRWLRPTNADAFREDPLRVLRAGRFLARYGHQAYSAHPDLLRLCTGMVAAGELDHLPRERVWSEVERAIGEHRPEEFFTFMRAVGGLDWLFCGTSVSVPTLKDLPCGGRWVTGELDEVFPRTPRAMSVLAALAVHFPHVGGLFQWTNAAEVHELRRDLDAMAVFYHRGDSGVTPSVASTLIALTGMLRAPADVGLTRLRRAINAYAYVIDRWHLTPSSGIAMGYYLGRLESVYVKLKTHPMGEEIAAAGVTDPKQIKDLVNSVKSRIVTETLGITI